MSEVHDISLSLGRLQAEIESERRAREDAEERARQSRQVIHEGLAEIKRLQAAHALEQAKQHAENTARFKAVEDGLGAIKPKVEGLETIRHRAWGVVLLLSVLFGGFGAAAWNTAKGLLAR